ncbi:MAG: hypothetical protein R3F56_20350 [Planctomycetota bacterium]
MRLLHRLPLVASLGTAALWGQQPQHAVAIVNDPRSHGQIGDNLLSLNEAIMLHNRTLLTSQMSQAEQMQIGFIGGDIAVADIDTTQVPTVTLERDLDTIVNLPHGLNISGSPYPATIDIGTTNGFLVDSDYCDFRRLILRGGAEAVRVVQRDTFYGSTFENVRFEGQTNAAVQVYLTQNDGETFLRFENSTFVNIPNPVRIDDLGRNRRGEIAMRGCLFDGGGEAFVVNLGPGGNSYNLRLDRSTFQNQTVAGLVVRRANASADRGVVLDLLDMVTRNVPTGISIDGHASALTDALVRMADLTASGTALRLGGVGTNTKIAVEDSQFGGSLALAGGAVLRLDNVRQTGGSTDLDGTTGTTVSASRSAFANVTTSVTGSSAATFTGCRFDGGAISGTASSPVTIGSSYVGGLNLGANASASGSIAVPQLASTHVAEQSIALGGTIHLAHDLPAGYLGVWLFSLGTEQPTTQLGMRVYMEMSTVSLYPGVWRGQGQAIFPMPNIRSLRGLDLVFQMLVGHDIGVPGPLQQMPPGGRVILR